MEAVNRPVDFAVAALTLPGQAESGDLFVVKFFAHGALIAVIDGLGHGPDAADAAKKAVATLELHAQEPVEDLIRRCHQALLRTRGVGMSLASINSLNNSLTQVGVGNVEVVLFRDDSETSRSREWLLVRGGVVGYELPTVKPSVTELKPGDLLVFATDGIHSGFGEGLPLDKTPQQTADLIMADFARGTDDALVLAARYIGESR
ncbi:MAG: SpoIIE family protein phosphatase [Actinomycetota bacterium]|nr:SpoIIE family protein phosphatase [Actinomycetota bacterium]